MKKTPKDPFGTTWDMSELAGATAGMGSGRGGFKSAKPTAGKTGPKPVSLKKAPQPQIRLPDERAAKAQRTKAAIDYAKSRGEEVSPAWEELNMKQRSTHDGGTTFHRKGGMVGGRDYSKKC